MGGAQSTDCTDGSLWDLDFSKAESYLIEWDIEDVTTAFNLYFYTLGAVPPRRINRDQFSKVFDPSKYNRLTMPQFDLFDSAEQGTVFALEPLVLLVLFCKGEPVDKYSFIFTAFDLNDDKSMSKDEITILVQCVVIALNTYGIIKMDLKIADVMKMVDQTFGDAPINPDDATSDQVFISADTNNDGVIDMEEFASWCSSNLWVKTLVEGFEAFRLASYELGGVLVEETKAPAETTANPEAQSDKPATPRVTIKMPSGDGDQKMFRPSSMPEMNSPTAKGLRKTKSFREQGKSFRNTDNVMDVMFAQMGHSYNSHDEMAKAVSVITARYRAHQAFAMVAEMKKNKTKVQDLLADAQSDTERAADAVKQIESQIASPITSDEKKADLQVELQVKVDQKDKMRRKSVQLERELHLHELAEQAQEEAIEAVDDYEKVLDQMTELAGPNDGFFDPENTDKALVEGEQSDEQQKDAIRKLSVAKKKELEMTKMSQELEVKAKAAEESAAKTTDGLLELQQRLASTRRASVAKSLEEQIAQMSGSIENKRKQSVMLQGYTGLEQQANQMSDEAEKLVQEQAALEEELLRAKAEEEEAARQHILQEEERLKNMRPEVQDLMRVKEYRDYLQGDVYTKRQAAEEIVEKLLVELDDLDTELMFGDKPKYQVKVEMMQHHCQVKLQKKTIADLDATLDLAGAFKSVCSKEEEAEKELHELRKRQKEVTTADGDEFYEINGEVEVQEKVTGNYHAHRIELTALLKAFKVSETMNTVRAKLLSLREEKNDLVGALNAAVEAAKPDSNVEIQQLKDAVEQIESIIEVKHTTLMKMDLTRIEIAERFEDLSGRIKILDHECENIDTEIFLGEKAPADKDKEKENDRQENLKQLKETLNDKSAEVAALKTKAKPLSHVNKHLTPFYSRPAGRNAVRIARIAPLRPRHPGVVADECAANAARVAFKAAFIDAEHLAIDAQAAADNCDFLFNSCCTVAGRDVRKVYANAQVRRRFQLQADISKVGAELVAEANAAIAALGLGVDTNKPLPQRLTSPRKSGSLPSGPIQGNSDRVPLHKIKRTFAADADDTALGALNVEISTLKTHYVDAGDRTQDYFKLLKIFQRFDRHRDGNLVVKDLKRMLERGDRDLLDLLQVPSRVLKAGYFGDPIKSLTELFATAVNLDEDSESMSFALFQESFDSYWLKISRQHASLVLQATLRSKRAMTVVFLMRQEKFRRILAEEKARDDAERKLAATKVQTCERARAARKERNRRIYQINLEKRIKQEAEDRKKAEQERKNAEMRAELERRRMAQEKEAERARMAALRASAIQQRRTSLVKIIQERQNAEEEQVEEKEDEYVYEDTGDDNDVRVSRMPKRKLKSDMTEEERLALREARLERNEQTMSLLANLRTNSVQPRFKTRKGKEPGQSKDGPDAGTSWLLHMKNHAKCSSTMSVAGSVTELGAQLSVPQIPTPPGGPFASQTPRHQRSHAQFSIRSGNRAKSASPRGRNHRNIHSAPASRQVEHIGQNPFLRRGNPPLNLPPGAHAQSTQSISVPKHMKKVRPSSAVYSHGKAGYRRKMQGSAAQLGVVQEQTSQPMQNNNSYPALASADHQPLILPHIATRTMMRMPSFGHGMAKRPYPVAPPIDALPLKN